MKAPTRDRRSHKGQRLNMWRESDMRGALDEWKAGTQKSIRKLALSWNVPAATLFKRTKKDVLQSEHMSGRNTVLNEAQEAQLVDLIKMLSRRGFPSTKVDVQRLAFQFCKQNGMSGFNNESGIAGRVWFDGFMKRHRDIRLRKPENLSAARAMGMNDIVVKSWFDHYLTVVKDLGIEDKPERFWNCDETGVQDQFDQGLGIGEVGRPSFRITPGEKGQTTTVLACFNAAGEFSSPMVIFKAKRIKAEWCVGSPPNTLVKGSDNGWITTELLTMWAENFLSSIPDDGLNRILILDGHITHTYNLKFLEMMKTRNFAVMCFPAHTTHWLQAADKSFFRSFKHNWNKLGTEFVRKHGGQHLSKAEFFQVFTPAWNMSAKSETAIAGFRGTGTWPISFDAIPKFAFDPSATSEREMVVPQVTAAQEQSIVPQSSSPNTADHDALEVTQTNETELDPLIVSVADLPSDLPEPVIAHIQELQELLQSHGLVSLIYRPGDLVTSAFDLSGILALNQSTSEEFDITNISATILTEEPTASTPNTKLPQQSTTDSGSVNTDNMTTPATMLTEEPIALTEEPTASTPNIELPQQSTVNNGSVNTDNMTTPATILTEVPIALTEEPTASTPNIELPQQSTVNNGSVNTDNMTTPATILTEEPIALTEEPTASTPNIELPQQSTVNSGSVNTVNMTTPATTQVDHPTMPDIRVAGCSFYDLCSLPKRERKARKRQLQSPSYHLTSEAHLDFVRNVLAKRQKVEEGRQRRKIAAEERKAKHKANTVVTGKRKQENCKAATKVTQKGKSANKAAADMKSRKAQDQSQSTRPPKNSRRPRKQAEMQEARKIAQKLTTRATADQEMNSPRKEVSEAVSVECIFCTEPYTDPPVDDWIKCSDCSRWCHEACSDTDKHNAAGAFVCGEC